MANLDAPKGPISESAEAIAASTRLSHAANDGPGKPFEEPAPTAHAAAETGRGHHAHAGGENKGTNEPPPSQPGPIDRTVTGVVPGIDVSEFQNTIDWSQVQQAGVKFAFIRATDGTTIQDTNFVQNWQGAEKAGIPVAAYHYFTTTSAVSTQITNFCSQLKLVDKGDMPPILDVEDPTQFSKFTPAQSVAMVQQWLDGVQAQTGVQPMLYMSSSFSGSVLGNAPQLAKYKLWVADYTTAPQPIVPQPWTNWNFWQYADNGQVAGITGGVDMDYFNGSTLPIPKPSPATDK
jgi:GH25 family lysozyme M1 (1,4-beta-N-acetylmuramidase)